MTPVKIGVEDPIGKVNCLIQSYISRIRIEGFSLVSDMAYVSQNIGRIARALFEISLKRGWALLSGRLLNICKSIEKQLWHFQSPMRQFEAQLKFDIINKIEEKLLSIEKVNIYYLWGAQKSHLEHLALTLILLKVETKNYQTFKSINKKRFKV